MTREAVILAGGLGTRLRSVVDDLPKPLAPVAGRPFLEYLLDHLISCGISDIVMAVGFRNEMVINHFGCDYKGLVIKYSIEKKPLGTGGAVLKALESVEGQECWIINGDTLFAVDLGKFYDSAAGKGFPVSLALKEMEDSSRYGCVQTAGKRVTAFREKGSGKKGLINGGVYLMDKRWLKRNSPGRVFSFEKDILEKNISQGFGYYVSGDYFIDIGIPSDYEKAERELPLIFNV
jgi:D-glycero-alpha-D-manno-heptose 1-phosphate guanylyltransferase